MFRWCKDLKRKMSTLSQECEAYFELPLPDLNRPKTALLMHRISSTYQLN